MMIEFTANYGGYNAGERATFSDIRAEALIARGVAQSAEQRQSPPQAEVKIDKPVRRGKMVTK